ncbi:hypothetical protein WJX79_009348 [Trebouxia sp. C0005]
MESLPLGCSTESQQAFCAGAKPGIEQPLRRAKLEDAPEVRRLLTPTGYDCFPLGIACTAYLETQAYFHKPQGHPPQFWSNSALSRFWPVPAGTWNNPRINQD